MMGLSHLLPSVWKLCIFYQLQDLALLLKRPKSKTKAIFILKSFYTSNIYIFIKFAFFHKNFSPNLHFFIYFSIGNSDGYIICGQNSDEIFRHNFCDSYVTILSFGLALLSSICYVLPPRPACNCTLRLLIVSWVDQPTNLSFYANNYNN